MVCRRWKLCNGWAWLVDQVKVSLKMLGDLRHYLPAGTQFNRCELELADGATASSVLTHIALPSEKTYLLMVNGDMIQRDNYATTQLNAGDEVVLFPPIKGG